MSEKLDAIAFLDYLRAFNKADYSAQHSFYTDDVELVLPDPAIDTLKGKKAVLAHYQLIHASAKETVVPIIVLSDRNKIFLQMEAFFVYQREVEHAVHDYHVYPSDVIKISCCAVYDLDAEGKMKRITCHLFNQELLGKVDIENEIKESQSKADIDLRLYSY